MNKLVVLFSSLAVAGVIWLFAASEPAAHIRHANEPLGEGEEITISPHGKVLYVVVDKEGVYLGEKKLSVADAKVAVNGLLKEHKIRNLVISGTEIARYGDVIELYSSIDPLLVRWRKLETQPITTGTRKPLTGFLVPRCCYSEDVENDDHDEQ